MGYCVHSDTETAWALKAQGLLDDGVHETSAMEVQMVALGTLDPVKAEKYDFNPSKLCWPRPLLQYSWGRWCRVWVVDWLHYSYERAVTQNFSINMEMQFLEMRITKSYITRLSDQIRKGKVLSAFVKTSKIRFFIVHRNLIFIGSYVSGFGWS